MSNLTVTCHCGRNAFSIPVTLPLNPKYKNIHICVCSDCRYQNGTLAGTFIPSPSAPFDPESTPETLTCYKSSAKASRYFCNTCSSQLFFRYETPEFTKDESQGFFIATGCLELPAGERFGIDSIGYVKDALDGGLASWISGEKITTTFDDPLTDEDIHALEAPAMSQQSDTEKLEGACHCGNIKLGISRPTGKQEELPPHTFSDNTDLVIPCWTPKEEQPPIDEKNPWWVRDAQNPGKGKRFLGGLCTCKSCRSIAGAEVQSWVFIPTVCIKVILSSGEVVPWPTKEQLENEPKYRDIIGTYKSTPGEPGVLRGFCKTCGANIFWDGLTRRNFVDISAGLFTHRGVREEGWIEWWTGRVSYVEDSLERNDIGTLLEKGLKEWKARLGGKA
ncbi:hypothetical protein AA313_de0201884 [Arthrobotrys entomopaga]|nr:hypothetical protein AA313_de0201884 [Arthrobotrys entomopaga]